MEISMFKKPVDGAGIVIFVAHWFKVDKMLYYLL